MADTTGNGLITLPLLALNGAGLNGSLGNGSIVLPLLTLSGSEGGARLPFLTLAGTGKSGTITALPLLRGASVLPALRLAATGVSQGLTSGNGAIGLPALTLSGYDRAAFLLHAGITLPAITLAATGLSGQVGHGRITLPLFNLAAAGLSSTLGSGAAALPLFSVAGQGISGTAGNLRAQLGRLALAAQGVTGTIGHGVLHLPIISLNGTGYANTIGQANILLPVLQLQATGDLPAAQASGAALVWQADNNAITTYSNFPFNSFALVGGVALGASENGIFALTGDTDAGAAIAASVAFGITDFGTEYLKRVTAAYVGYRTDGKLSLTVTTDEHYKYQYTLEQRGRSAGLHANRKILGKGVRGRYWQVRIDNRNGADFDIDQLTLQADVLSRKLA